MSDSYLPKIFEGFPELADKAKALEAALNDLQAAADAALAAPTAEDPERVAELEKERDALSARIGELETAAQAPATETDDSDIAALTEEVAHWKEKYDALAGKFDAEIAEAQQAAGAQTGALEEKNALITELEDSKEKAASEIARLAADLATSRGETTAAQTQLDELNQQLSAVQSDLGDTSAEAPAPADDRVAALEGELSEVKAALEAKTAELAEAIEKADASETARANAASRLNALIDSLNAARSAGAA
ncbi:MAG: hypothetical protein AAF337_10450 [Pseudomonadota bacterium]